MSLDNRLVFIGLHTSDLEKSTTFYRDIFGVPLEVDSNPGDDPWMGGSHAELSWREGAYLHFALFPQRLPERPTTKDAQIGFFVEDVDDLHPRAADAGVTVLHPPRDEPWGRTARYLNPDSNIVDITAR
jgi:predicted enzyme related to lactoylglutathione lyase